MASCRVCLRDSASCRGFFGISGHWQTKTKKKTHTHTKKKKKKKHKKEKQNKKKTNKQKKTKKKRDNDFRLSQYNFQETYSYLCDVVTADNSTLRIYSLRLFGSVIERWINPAARARFPPKSWDFFSALFAMLCSLLRLSCRKNVFGTKNRIIATFLTLS